MPGKNEFIISIAVLHSSGLLMYLKLNKKNQKLMTDYVFILFIYFGFTVIIFQKKTFSISTLLKVLNLQGLFVFKRVLNLVSN